MIHGKNHIGNNLSATGGIVLHAVDAETWKPLEGGFIAATSGELELALEKAVQAFAAYKKFSGERKAVFLEAIAEEIEALGETLIHRAMAESGLPKGRLIGERGRTCNQLRLFAKLLRDGSWVDVKIETAQPNRQPIPKGDIRKMLLPIGPVAVFTASNFPLAFSTAGGDTASALAAGCPVIVKAHESHLGTNQLVSDAIIKAAQKTGMPDGVFSSLQSKDYTLGAELVQHPAIQAVGFTGSQKGGKAIFDLCQERAQPIPVYAEMGSVNPVLLLPNKLHQEKEELAKTYANSITLGAGQFCTNPGILIAMEGEELDSFAALLVGKLAKQTSATMLNEKIWEHFHAGIYQAVHQEGVTVVWDGNSKKEKGAIRATIVRVAAKDFLANPTLREEVFGAFTVIVSCEHAAEMEAVTKALAGQLTVTAMTTDEDVQLFEDFLKGLPAIAGRVIFNGAPTGVEVCSAMHHGGAYPASTNSKYTSVGQDAIKRFVHPVAFQNCPAALLPEALKDENPLGIWRLVDGDFSQKAIVPKEEEATALTL